MNRSVEAGKRTNRSAGRTGRFTRSPPQFGQCPPGNRVSAQVRQNVHSNEQILASAESGGKSRSQHSQFGLSSSIATPPSIAGAPKSAAKSAAGHPLLRFGSPDWALRPRQGALAIWGGWLIVHCINGSTHALGEPRRRAGSRPPLGRAQRIRETKHRKRSDACVRTHERDGRSCPQGWPQPCPRLR